MDNPLDAISRTWDVQAGGEGGVKLRQPGRASTVYIVYCGVYVKQPAREVEVVEVEVVLVVVVVVVGSRDQEGRGHAHRSAGGIAEETTGQ